MPKSSASNSEAERAIPHSLEAEKALLGSILLNNEALPFALNLLSAFDFYSQAHRIILEKMIGLHEQQRTIDLVTLSEELSYEEKLEKAGGAEYLAALTDGIPIGTTGALQEYCRIIKDKSRTRQVINTAQNLIAHALCNGNDPDSLLELAYEQIQDLRLKDDTASNSEGKIEVVGKVEPGKKPSEEDKPKNRYPEIRPDAWHPVAKMYLQAVQHTSEAADSWHFIAFYTTIGALLGASIRGRMAGSFSPNLYAVLVGYVGGDGKTGSIRRMFDFAGMIDDRLYIPRSINSAPGFIKNWASFNQKHSIEDNTRAILRLGELVSLLDTAAQSGTHSIIPLLNDAYDNEPLVNDSIQSPFRVDKPHLSAIFGSASKYLKKMKEEDLETGFGRRLCFCPGDPKPAMPYPPDPDASILIPLAGAIKETLLYWQNRENNRLELSPSAHKLWEPWYKRYKSRLKEDDLIAAMTIGDRLTVQKIALINAALDKSERYIEDHQLSAATEFGEYLYESRFPLFSEHGANPFVEVEHKILDKIPLAPNRIAKRWVQRQLSGIDSKVFNDRIKYLTMDDGPLQIRHEGRKVWLWRT